LYHNILASIKGSNDGSREKEKIAQKVKTNEKESKMPTKKMGQGKHASVGDSPHGNQLKNTDEVVGTA
jgi:hypothetical protein